MISPKSDGYVLQDLNSRNGTLVNGQRISERPLVPNDRIHAGQTNFVFVDGLATVIGQLENEPKGYRTYVRELSKDDKP